MPAPQAKLEKVKITLTLEDGWYIAHVEVPEVGVQATQGRTVRSALLAAAEVVSLMTEEA